MRVNAHPPVYIFALNRATKSEDLALIHRAGIEHFGHGKGCYKGQTENCYLVSAENFEKIKPFIRDCKQETVLFLDNQRNGFLLDEADDYRHTAASVYLGEYSEVSVTQASRLDAWSSFDGKYYVCRK